MERDTMYVPSCSFENQEHRPAKVLNLTS